MNALAFTNHLLSDVFALTAIMREARDRHTDPLIPEILQAWTKIGPIFARSSFPKRKSGANLNQITEGVNGNENDQKLPER